MFGVFGMPATGETRAKERKRARPLALSVLVGVLFAVLTCVADCVAVCTCTVCVYSHGCLHVNTCSALLPAGPGNLQLLQTVGLLDL